MRAALVVAVALGLVACHAASPAPSPQGADAGAGLVASFDPASVTVHAGTLPKVTLVVSNGSAAPQRINRYVLGVPQLALDVTGAGGAAVSSSSPPVPRAFTEDDFETLAPGGSYRTTLELSAFAPPLAAGTYEVRARGYGGTAATVVIEP